LRSNRKWLIRDYIIWGNSGQYQADIIVTETGSPNNRIVFHHQYTGGQPHNVKFSDLIDHRGNQLPENISNAEVILIPKNSKAGYVMGPIGQSSFFLAKSSDDSENPIVDLLIMEMN
jgi:hypothetical protein